MDRDSLERKGGLQHVSQSGGEFIPQGTLVVTTEGGATGI